MATYSGRKAALYVTSATTPIAFTGEATTGDTDKKRYTINSNAKRYWDEDSGVTVKVGATPVDASLYDVEYAGGVIVFHVARLAGDVVTVDGKYYTYAVKAGGKEFDVENDCETYETPMFGAQGYKTKCYGLTGSKVTINGWFMDDNMSFLDLGYLAGKKLLVVGFMSLTNSVNVTGPRYEGFGYISKDSLKANAKGANEENITVEIDGQLYYRPS